MTRFFITCNIAPCFKTFFTLYFQIRGIKATVINFTVIFNQIMNELRYSVFKKEGNKVNAYYTNEKGIFGSTMRFFPTKTEGHFVIYRKVLKFVP